MYDQQMFVFSQSVVLLPYNPWFTSSANPISPLAVQLAVTKCAACCNSKEQYIVPHNISMYFVLF